MVLSGLFKPKWQHPKADVRCLGISQLSLSQPEHCEILAELALTDPAINVRRSAVGKLIDLDQLAKVIDSDVDESVKAAAVIRVRELLAGEVNEAPSLEVRRASLAIYSDPDTLLYVVMNGSDDEICKAALERVGEESYLMEIATGCSRAKLRVVAAERLSSSEFLEQVSRISKNKDNSVYQVVRNKLYDRRQALRDTEELQRQMTSLCEKMERLTRLVFYPSYDVEYEVLISAWECLDTSIYKDIATRFDQARKKTEQILQQHVAEITERHEREATLQQSTEMRKALIKQIDTETIRYKQTPIESDEHFTELESSLKNMRESWLEISGSTNKEQTRFNNACVMLENYLQSVKRYLKAKTTIATINDEVGQLKIPDGIPRCDYLSKKIKQQLARIDWPEMFNMPDILVVADISLKRLDELDKERDNWQKKNLPKFKTTIQSLSEAIESGLSKDAEPLMKEIDKLSQLLPSREVDKLRHKISGLYAELSKLRGWKRFATMPKKEALCKQMEALIDKPLDPKERADFIKALQDEWKALESKGGVNSQALWQRFKEAADKAFIPCREHYQDQDQQRAQNLVQCERMCVQLEEYIGQSDWKNADWGAVEKTIQVARNEWSQFRLYRKEGKLVQKRFDDLIEQLYSKLKEERSLNAGKKQDLIDKARELATEEDLKKAMDKAKFLQSQWKEVGTTARNEDRKLWKEFRAACDAVFDRLDQQRQAYKSELQDNCKQAELLIEKIKALGENSDEALGSAKKEFQQLQEAFRALGSLPSDSAAKKIQKEFNKACETYENKLSGIPLRKKRKQFDELKRKAQLCHSIEQGLLTVMGFTEQALEQTAKEWSSDVTLPEEVNKLIEQRYTNAYQAVQQKTSYPFTDVLEENLQKRQQLCIQMEILLDIDTPESYKQMRMDYQLQLLSRNFGNAGSDAERSKVEQAEDIMKQWYCTGPVDAENAEALEVRFNKATLKLNEIGRRL